MFSSPPGGWHTLTPRIIAEEPADHAPSLQHDFTGSAHCDCHPSRQRVVLALAGSSGRGSA